MVAQKTPLVGPKHSRRHLRVAVHRLQVGMRRLVVVGNGGKPRLGGVWGGAESLSVCMEPTCLTWRNIPGIRIRDGHAVWVGPCTRVSERVCE